jgi:toxin ParE1/3/4
LSPYPYLVFYLDMPQEIDVLRVLHGSMDIPAWLDP